MSKTTTTPPITDRTGRRAVHTYVSDDCHDEWNDAADAHGISVTAIIEALGPRLDRILTEHPGLVTDARRVFSARRKRNDR